MNWRLKEATIIEKILTLKAEAARVINLPSGDFGMKPVLKGVNDRER